MLALIGALLRAQILGNRMKLYGYADEGLSIEEIVPAVLAEVTLCATPEELRRMAGFLTFCASEMDRMGAKYDHVHLADRMEEFGSSPHFVVAKEPEDVR
jgi:hypothetical protein